jgi:hypothetical protein
VVEKHPQQAVVKHPQQAVVKHPQQAAERRALLKHLQFVPFLKF